jgi:hypothetical protein
MSRRKRLAVAVVLVLGVFGLLTPAVFAGPSTTASLRIGNASAGKTAQRQAQHRPQSTHDDHCSMQWDLP